jgi:thiol-disulfide isomerase/thioredoxin
MTPQLFFWFRLAIIAYFGYQLFSIGRTMKKRGYIVPREKKDWTSLFSDVLFIGLSIFLLFIIRNNYEKPMDAVMAFQDQSLPQIEFLDARTGNVTTLTKNGTVILNIWATWCPPCRKEMPDLEEVQLKYASSNVKIVALSDEDEGTVKAFLDKHPYRFTIGTFTQMNELLNSIQTRPVSILLINGQVKDIVVGARGTSFFSDWAERGKN